MTNLIAGPRHKLALVHMTCELGPTIAITFATIIFKKKTYLTFHRQV